MTFARSCLKLVRVESSETRQHNTHQQGFKAAEQSYDHGDAGFFPARANFVTGCAGINNYVMEDDVDCTRDKLGKAMEAPT